MGLLTEQSSQRAETWEGRLADRGSFYYKQCEIRSWCLLGPSVLLRSLSFTSIWLYTVLPSAAARVTLLKYKSHHVTRLLNSLMTSHHTDNKIQIYALTSQGPEISLSCHRYARDRVQLTPTFFSLTKREPRVTHGHWKIHCLLWNVSVLGSWDRCGHCWKKQCSHTHYTWHVKNWSTAQRPLPSASGRGIHSLVSLWCQIQCIGAYGVLAFLFVEGRSTVWLRSSLTALWHSKLRITVSKIASRCPPLLLRIPE